MAELLGKESQLSVDQEGFAGGSLRDGTRWRPLLELEAGAARAAAAGRSGELLAGDSIWPRPVCLGGSATAVRYALGLGAERPAESPAKLVELCPLLAYIGQPCGGGLRSRQPVLQP